MKLSKIKIDSSKVEEGEWVSDIPRMGDLKLHVRGLDNADYRKLQARLSDAAPRSRTGRIEEKEADRILTECLVETVLLGWQGIQDDDGAEIAFAKDKARELLSDPDLTPFRTAVIWAASVVGDNREGAKDTDRKN